MQGARHRWTVHLGQACIEQHEVGMQLKAEGQGARAVLGFAHDLVPRLPLQNGDGPGPCHEMIIDDNNADSHARTPSLARSWGVARGTVTVTVVPEPGAVAISSVPFISWTRCSRRARPR